MAQLRCSAGWQRWLTVRAQIGLRRYSVRNQLLIALQDPTCTHVAGFRAWLKLGYCVRRGATSHIRVWAPCPPSKTKLAAWRAAGAIPEDKPRTYFRLEAVFSQAQVDPLGPPAEPAPLGPPIAAVQGDSLAWALAPLQQLAASLGYSVVYRTLAKGHGGSCDPTAKVLTINDDQSINARVDVACHELAHALMPIDRRDEDPALGYAEEELVAESVAHLAVTFVGLDSSASAVPYLAAWAQSTAPGTFQRIAALVDRLARRLEDALSNDDTPPDAATDHAIADDRGAAGREA